MTTKKKTPTTAQLTRLIAEKDGAIADLRSQLRCAAKDYDHERVTSFTIVALLDSAKKIHDEAEELRAMWLERGYKEDELPSSIRITSLVADNIVRITEGFAGRTFPKV